MVARLCSRKSMPHALVDSEGAAITLPSIARNLEVPMDRIFFARWSKCESRSEQYWFVPENSKFEYDEMIPAERVRVNRSLVSYYENPSSQPARSEFEKILKEFVAELQNNPKTDGFIIRNTGVSNRNIEDVLRQLRNEKIEETRFQIVRKQIYKSYYPEFMTVTITQYPHQDTKKYLATKRHISRKGRNFSSALFVYVGRSSIGRASHCDCDS